MERLRIGSRASRLARRQAGWVGSRLERAWPGLRVEYRTFSTEGDRRRDRPLPEIGGKGLFTADLERALAAEEIDLAVHSLKDLPSEGDPRFDIVAVPEREDPRDVFVSPSDAPATDLDGLPPGARVGTSSLRRQAQLRARRPDVEPLPIRGNVETRISKLDRGEYDAVILAAAGLRRLGLWRPGMMPLDPPAWLPAPGQGALAVQGRARDEATRRAAAAIEDPAARAAVRAERAFLAELEGGCQVPIAALASVREGRIRLAGAVHPLRGEGPAYEGERQGGVENAEALGVELARTLAARGAAEIVRRARRQAGLDPGRRQAGEE